jgi:hypothetical protein
MNLKKLTDKARVAAEDLIQKRGGNEALKRDAEQVKDAFKGPGTMKDKAKAAADAVKKPG